MQYLLVVFFLFLTSCAEKIESLRRIGSKPKFTETTIPTTDTSLIHNNKHAYSDKFNHLNNTNNETHKKNVYTINNNQINISPKSQKSNSLWTKGNKSFFQDQRATKVGDILTIIIDVKDQQAKLTASNTIASSNSNSLLNIRKILKSIIKESHVANAVLGNPYEKTPIDDNAAVESGEEKKGAMPAGEDLSKVSGNLISRGGDTLKFNVAAIIKSQLANGNLYLEGNQEIIVDYEKRQITISGIIRPEDISSENTIAYDKIAEARISYGGEGAMSRQQKPRYGTELLDIISPF